MAYPSKEEAQARIGSKSCPVRQCYASISMSKIMCDGHWEGVTSGVREAILDGWSIGDLPHQQPKTVRLLITQACDQAYEHTT